MARCKKREMIMILGCVLNQLGLGCVLLLSIIFLPTYSLFSQEESQTESSFTQVIKLELNSNYESSHQNVYLKDISNPLYYHYYCLLQRNHCLLFLSF